MTRSILEKIFLGSALTVALAFASGCSKDSATNGMGPMTDAEHRQMQTK